MLWEHGGSTCHNYFQRLCLRVGFPHIVLGGKSQAMVGTLASGCFCFYWPVFAKCSARIVTPYIWKNPSGWWERQQCLCYSVIKREKLGHFRYSPLLAHRSCSTHVSSCVILFSVAVTKYQSMDNAIKKKDWFSPQFGGWKVQIGRLYLFISWWWLPGEMSNDDSIRKRDRRVRQEATEEFFHNGPSDGAAVSTYPLLRAALTIA